MRRLAVTRGAGDDDEPLMVVGRVADRRGESEAGERRRLSADEAKRRLQPGALARDVDPESSVSIVVDREVA